MGKERAARLCILYGAKKKGVVQSTVASLHQELAFPGNSSITHYQSIISSHKKSRYFIFRMELSAVVGSESSFCYLLR